MSSGASRIAGDRPVPHIVTELPGPKARAHVAFDETWTSPSLPRAYPIVPVRGDGLTVEDIDGNLFLDFAAGHRGQLDRPRAPAGRRRDQGAGRRADPLLARRTSTCRSTPRSAASWPASRRSPGRVRAYLGNSGTEVVEASIKLARFATKRPYIVAFLGAFHGRTYGVGLADRLEGEVPRRLRAAAAGRLPRAVRPGRGPALVRRGPVRQARPGQRGRGDHRRADPGRGRLHRPRGRLPPGPPRDLRPARHPAHRRRDPVGRRADRQDVGGRALGRRARHPADRQGHRVAACRSGAMVARAELLEAWGAGRPRLDLRRQPGRLRGRARDDRAARGRPHRERRRPRRAGSGRPAAADRPVRRARPRRPRQGPDARHRVRHAPTTPRRSSGPASSAACSSSSAASRASGCRPR